MMFSQKVETVGGIKDFLTPSPAKKKIITSSLIAGAGMGIGAIATTLHSAPQAVSVMAMPAPIVGLGGIGITTKIIHAFDPLTELIQGLSYPVGFIMITAGCLVIMTGKKQQGLNMIKWAAIGYIAMQFAPGIMALLAEVGKAILTK